MRGRKRKIHVIGEVPKLVSRVKIETVSVTSDTESKAISQVQVVNFKRSALGLLTMLDDLGVLVPRCAKCYEAHKWLNRCECQK